MHEICFFNEKAVNGMSEVTISLSTKDGDAPKRKKDLAPSCYYTPHPYVSQVTMPRMLHVNRKRRCLLWELFGPWNHE